MPSEHFETIFQRDLDRLDGLADHEVLPPASRRRARLTFFWAGAAIAAALLVGVVGLSVQGVRDAQLAADEGAATSSPPFITAEPTGGAFSPSTSVIAGNALTGAPMCPIGSLPWIHVAQAIPPGDVPGTGSASADAAFQRANPTLTDFTMYPWGGSQPIQVGDPRTRGRAPVWIVAGNETYIAVAPGGPGQGTNNWFAHPAQFMGCGTPSIEKRARPTTGP